MKIHELKSILEKHPSKQPRFVLPNGEYIPPHFHITEVGHISKRFIDCGGTIRELSSCALQVWLGSDKHHRLDTNKFRSILELGSGVLPSEDLDIEVEYEDCAISQFPLVQAENSQGFLDLHLDLKHTDCLAKEACGIEPSSNCCTKSGCC